MIMAEKTTPRDALRLALIYALRYEKSHPSHISALVETLRRRSIPDDHIMVRLYILCGRSFDLNS